MYVAEHALPRSLCFPFVFTVLRRRRRAVVCVVESYRVWIDWGVGAYVRWVGMYCIGEAPTACSQRMGGGLRSVWAVFACCFALLHHLFPVPMCHVLTLSPLLRRFCCAPLPFVSQSPLVSTRPRCLHRCSPACWSCPRQMTGASLACSPAASPFPFPCRRLHPRRWRQHQCPRLPQCPPSPSPDCCSTRSPLCVRGGTWWAPPQL
jgi:hypothetical protein